MARFSGSTASPAPPPSYSAHWPSVASYALLPNVAGSPTQSASVVSGDSCFITGLGNFVCSDATLGNAVWEAQLPLAPREVLVRREADFPAPVGGVITLVADTVYTIRGTVNLTAGNRIVSPARVKLAGRLSLVDQIVGDYNGPLVSFVDPTSPEKFDVRDLIIQNVNAGASSYAFLVNAPNANWRVELSKIIGGFHGISIVSAGNISWTSVAAIGGAGADAVRVSGAIGAGAASLSSFQSSGTNGNGIHFLAGSSITTMTMDANGFIQLSASCTGIRAEAGATVGTAYINRAVSFGPGPLNVGWDQGTPGFKVTSSPPLSDSVAGGGSTAPSGVDFTLSIPVMQTYYDVTDGVSRYTLDPGTERFTLVSGVNGEIRYIGKQTRRFLVQGLVSVEKTGTTSICRAVLSLNGNPIASTMIETDVATTAHAISTMPLLISLSNNDTLKVQFANWDNTNSILVHSSGVTAIGLGG